MPDTGNVVVVNRPVADVDPKLGQFAVSFTVIPQCPRARTGDSIRGVTAALVVGSATKST